MEGAGAWKSFSKKLSRCGGNAKKELISHLFDHELLSFLEHPLAP
jgi:hypothetical protein